MTYTSGACPLLTSPLLRTTLLLATALLTILTPTQTVAQSDSAVSVEVHGFVNATGFWQDRTFLPSNGQTALWIKNQPGDTSYYGGDIRDTHIILQLHGPTLSSWQLSGTMSMDFFGGFKGDGTFAFVQPRPRLLHRVHGKALAVPRTTTS